MGLMFSIVSRFRKRATTKEVLEGIDEDIKKLESTLERNQKLQKKIVLSLLSFSVLAYGIAVAVFYFFLLPDNWSDRAIWILPFLSFPILVYFLKKVFHFFFVTRIKRIRKALGELNERKKQILEDVTENETYKIAKELLEKYDPHGKIIPREFAVKSIEKESKTPDRSDELRFRGNATKPQESNGRTSTPRASSSPAVLPGQPFPVRPNMSPRFQSPGAINGHGLPRPFMNRGPSQPRPNLQQQYPIPPRERSFFDQVAEYFVGDGPSYRYALICKACHSHNGMALKDEFEYIAFRCCYCGFANEARKKRLNAPTLEAENRTSDRESDKEKSNDTSKENDDEKTNEDDKVVTETKVSDTEDKTDKNSDIDQEKEAKNTEETKRNSELEHSEQDS